MAVSPGWAVLGNTIAGGNSLNQATAYERGAQMSAQTADALEQARSRRDENVARAGIYEKLDNITDPAERAATAALIQAHVNPGEVANSQKTNQEVRFRNDIVNPATSDTDVGRRALALNQKGPIQSLGEGNVINELHPVDTTGAPAVVPTAIGTAIAGQHSAAAENQTAEAALHRDQVTNPQKYRVLPPGAAPAAPGAAKYDGSTPHPQNETTAQLIAAGQMAPPGGGTKAFQMLGGEDFMKRVNYLAGQPGAPGVAAGPPAVPGVAPAPGAAAAPQPFKANFNANNFTVNRTTANDFARSTGTGGKLDSVNRIAGHLGVLEDLYNHLDDTNYVPVNQVKNAFYNQTGKQYPGSARLASQMLGTEIVKSMTNVGAGGVEERTSLANDFGPNGTPEGKQTAINTVERLVGEQAKDLAMRGARGNLKGIYTPGQFFSPEAIKRYSLVDPAAAPPTVVTPPAGAVDPSDPLGIRVKK